MNRRPRPGAVVTGYRAVSAVIAALPRPVALRLGAAAGTLMWALKPGKRAMVERHQARIRGRAGGAQTRAAFRSYGRFFADAFRLGRMGGPELDALADVEGLEHVEAGLAAGKGVIMAMPHLGAWDLGGAWFARRYPLTVVAERLEPPELFDWFVALRQRVGITVVPLGPEAGGPLLKALRDNGVLGLLCDRDIAGGGVEVTFFGERVTLPGGPATFALRTGAAVLPNAMVYAPGGRLRGIIGPPLPVVRSGRGLRADVEVLTQQIAVALEDLIRAHPEQWHVQQPVWPSDRQGGAPVA